MMAATRTLFLVSILLAYVHRIASAAPPDSAPASQPQGRFLLDSGYKITTGDATGQAPDVGNDRLSALGYTGAIVGSIEGIQTYDGLAPGLLAADSKERNWAIAKADSLRSAIAAAHQAGLKCFAYTDLIVLPKALVERLRDQICDANGRIDILLPKTQEVFRAMLQETFDLVPDLDGVVIRTGEVYLLKYPYHTASAIAFDKKIQGNTAIIHGPQSHIELLQILRDEVCVKRNKRVFYRTWDFNNFHEKPDYYLQVTDAIEPHPNLVFSIKHQKGDFHQLTPFNPTLMIGKHRQIIEVQAQREAYGKGAHPYYIGQGVIDGWEEYDWLMKPGQPKSLRDVIDNPLCAGVWIWSRGGGWDGPVISNGIWCDLNAYVVAKFAEDPARTEESIFNEFAAHLGLSADDVKKFRELNLLSTKAVLRGQLTTLPSKFHNLWWARDDTLLDPKLKPFVDEGLVEQAIAEKAQAVDMWKQIESLSHQIHFADHATQDFVETSATYGRIKYDIIAQAWTAILLGMSGDATGKYDKPRIAAAIEAYDGLWKAWQELKDTHACCSTLYHDVGLGNAMKKYRQLK